MQRNPDGLAIGALANAAGVKAESIRYYQRRKLMPEPVRPHGGIRRYSERDLARLRFIKAALGLGFTLDELGELLKLEDGTRCDEARSLAERKLQAVREKLDDLRRIETTLSQLVARCGALPGAAKCPLIASLQQI